MKKKKKNTDRRGIAGVEGLTNGPSVERRQGLEAEEDERAKGGISVETLR